MALKTFVKISEVNNLSDARYCAGMGVNLIGFSLDPTNPKAVTPEQFTEITGWISGVKLVGEFYESSPLVIKELLGAYAVDYLQIKTVEELDYLSTINIPILLNIDVSTLDEPEYLAKIVAENSDQVAYFLLTTSDSESDEETFHRFSPEIVRLSNEYPIILGFAVSSENVVSRVQSTGVTGIALQGGDEIKPGYKDFGELADILEILEVDDME